LKAVRLFSLPAGRKAVTTENATTFRVDSNEYMVLTARETAVAWRAAILRDLDEQQAFVVNGLDRDKWVAGVMGSENAGETLSCDNASRSVDGFNVFRVR